MKLGGAEGTPKEFTDFFQDNGLDPSHYFQKVDNPISTRWVVIPAILIFLVVIAIWLMSKTQTQYQWPTFLLGCLGVVWLGVSTQLRFKQPMVTAFASVGCLAVLVVAFGLLTPLEAIEQLKQLRK